VIGELCRVNPAGWDSGSDPRTIIDHSYVADRDPNTACRRPDLRAFWNAPTAAIEPESQNRASAEAAGSGPSESAQSDEGARKLPLGTAPEPTWQSAMFTIPPFAAGDPKPQRTIGAVDHATHSR
jgi:hypothetical protein